MKNAIAAVGPEQRLRGGDVLVFVGVVESVADLQRIRGLSPATDQVAKMNSARPRALSGRGRRRGRRRRLRGRASATGIPHALRRGRARGASRRRADREESRRYRAARRRSAAARNASALSQVSTNESRLRPRASPVSDSAPPRRGSCLGGDCACSRRWSPRPRSSRSRA